MKTKPQNSKAASKNSKPKPSSGKKAVTRTAAKPTAKPPRPIPKAAPRSGGKIRRVEPVTTHLMSSKPVNKFVKPVTPVAVVNGANGINKPTVVAKARLAELVEVIIFKQGDKIVYPGHGVGEIEMVRTTTIGGQEQQFYSIIIIDSGMKVMVPVSQASAVGLRRIIDKKTIDQVYTILRDRNFKIDTQTWNRRFREYSQKIKTGSVYEIAVVLRDLSVLSSDKELSFGEKKMLDMAQNLLASEIAIAKSRPQDKIVGELREIFN